MEFRLKFLDIYVEFGLDTRLARDELLETLNDFPGHPLAIKAICTRFVRDYEPTDPDFPFALDKTCNEFQNYIDKDPNSALLSLYVEFLQNQAEIVQEDNLKEYLSIIMDQLFKKASERGIATISMYLSWYQKSQLATVLDKGLEEYPSSCILWLEKLKLVALDGKQQFFDMAIENVGGGEQLGIWREYLKWSEGHAEQRQIELMYQVRIDVFT
jgi:hypothetical protein